MTQEIIEMARQAGMDYMQYISEDNMKKVEAFAKLVAAKDQASAFRAGILYAAKKYADVAEDVFTGNDVNMFLEMEEAELSDEEIISIRARGEA